ncbi:DUF6188 family protein [Jidongwangia harbinensis]|uniref:DUF6188 family protein n=1 Tax=Jidongwangia harbinensis TaxID=2878561 RepID=UPI001CDA2485|nr:DUF6188 family protein [Jidongwangia harbinensis]MCA2218430.1 DUF6188 family protein [Jidongwangia harbinensis]
MLPVMVAGVGGGRPPGRARSIDELVGQKLEYIRLGHAIVLSFSGGRQVLIETVTRLNGPSGPVDVEPGDDASDALATLLGDVVRVARVRDNGELHIRFRGGPELVVCVDDDVESWAVTGPGGFLIVCLARGEVAVWGDGEGRG